MFFLLLLQVLAFANVATSANVAVRRPTVEEALRNPTKVLVIPKHKSSYITPAYAATTSTYWMVYTQYSGSTCDTSVAQEYGIATGWCMDTGSDSSVMYTCTSATECFVHLYDDAVCGTESAGSPFPYDVGVCSSNTAEDDGMLVQEGTDFASQQVVVSQGFPQLYSGSSGMLSSYGSTTCVQSSMWMYVMYYQNYCYNYYDGTDYTSDKFVSPYSYEYDSLACASGDIVGKHMVPINSCEIDSATTSSMATVTSDGGGKSDKTGMIVGAVIGSIAGVILIGALIYFFAIHKAKAPMGQQAEMSSKA